MDNMNKEFEKVFDEIKAPKDLKEETLAKMFLEDEKVNTVCDKTKEADKVEVKSAKKKTAARIYRFGALALTACAAALCFVLLRPAGAVYVTPIEDGNYYETVELEDGIISFVQNRVSISVSPNAGHASLGAEEEKEITEETEEIIAEEETERGGSLVLKKMSYLSFADAEDRNWSYIGEQKIYVTVLNGEEGFKAVYEKGEAFYELTGINVTQKEFIDFLYKQVM